MMMNTETTTTTTNLTDMTPSQIDKMLVDLYHERSMLDYELKHAMQTATSGGLYGRIEVVVRAVYEAIEVQQFGYKSTERLPFYVLESDYAASACEISPYGGHEVRTHVNNNCLISVTLESLTDKRISAKTALEIVVAEDRSVRGDAVREIVKRQTEVRALIDAIDAEYDARGRWTRFFLVTSSTGHIHSSTSCHTCNKGKNATAFALVCHLSGEQIDRAVEVFGPALCSFCYPDAPVEMTEQAKISGSLATAYEERGYEGWLEAKAKADARRAKREGK